MGLALVKGLTELHGGEVVASSDGPGKGASFTLRLPLDAAAKPPEEKPRESSLVIPSRRVLIIEDNIDASESLRMLLELLGHTVELASSGPQGAEIARLSRPDVVLCDIGLPGMDGYAVARAIRSSAGAGDVYLVAITGYGQKEDQEQALVAGFRTHLTKPVNLETLKEILANAPIRNGNAGAPS